MGQAVKRFMGNIKPGFYKKSNDSLDSVDSRQCPSDLNAHPALPLVSRARSGRPPTL